MTAAATKAVVNTGKVQRRKLRFETIEAALAEARRVAALEEAGQAECLGNWTVGQILNHVGAWAEFAYAPNPIKAPWFVKVVARMMKGRFLNKGLPAGGRIPRVPGGTLATERVGAAEGLARMERAFTRLEREVPTQPSPVFGKMTQEEAIKLNLRHAELHLGFIKN